MALLLGNNADRIISLTFIVGSSFCQPGRCSLIASHMGQVNFGIGFRPGSGLYRGRAGGIGSIPGAMLGPGGAWPKLHYQRILFGQLCFTTGYFFFFF